MTRLEHALEDLKEFQKKYPNLEVFPFCIEALEKQIPKKADGAYCNRCGWQVKKLHKVSGQYSGVADGYAYREEKHDYCESCGQAIDWESDKE